MRKRTYRITTQKQLEGFNYTTRALITAAIERGWDVEYTEAMPDNSRSGVARATKRGREMMFLTDHTILSPIYSFFIAENKELSAALFERDGVPTPESEVLAVDADAAMLRRVLKRLGKVVVKPLDANHGDGITVGVENEKALRAAIRFTMGVKPENGYVLVQRQVEEAKEYRFLVLRGKVIAVAHRRAPFVAGDGKRTVRELIEELNRDPRRGEGHKTVLTVISLDDVIAANGEAFLDMVPPVGEEVEVLKTSNLSKGGVSEDFTDRASREIKNIAVRAANGCYLGLAGVDIMTRDIESGGAENSWVIEVNSAPGLRMHEYPSIGKPRQVSKMIIMEIEKHAQIIKKPVRKIGRVEYVSFLGRKDEKIPARVDTGAAVSAIHATDIKETGEGGVSFRAFGHKVEVGAFTKRAVQTSTGEIQVRYMVKLPVALKGRKIVASFTLANRAKQSYPVLIGRNIIKNKFIVDVSVGKAGKRYRDTRKKLDNVLKIVSN